MATARTSAAARPYHHGSLREALVEAGLSLARTGGPEAVLLRAVSREAVVSHNAAYRHFADHDELLGAVGERCMRNLALLMGTRTDEVRVRQPVKRARAELDAIGRAYIEFAQTEPGWFRTAFAAVKSDQPGDHAQLSAAETPPSAGELNPYQLLSARLDRLVAVGEVPAERRPGAEYSAWSVVHGLSCLLVDGPLRYLPRAEIEVAINTALALVQRGL
jgi:AcrR family transcriptional regulator